MASVMAGHCPPGGINLGPALTVGFVAGRHAAGCPRLAGGAKPPVLKSSDPG